MGRRLRVDMIACDGYGHCHELLPELIALDRWGYPILPERDVPDALLPEARRAVELCPVLALRLEARHDVPVRASGRTDSPSGSRRRRR